MKVREFRVTDFFDIPQIVSETLPLDLAKEEIFGAVRYMDSGCSWTITDDDGNIATCIGLMLVGDQAEIWAIHSRVMYKNVVGTGKIIKKVLGRAMEILREDGIISRIFARIQTDAPYLETLPHFLGLDRTGEIFDDPATGRRYEVIACQL